MEDRDFLIHFTEHYDPARDYAWIECQVQSKADANEAFRMQLCAFLEDQLDHAPLPLIRDLFLELSKSAACNFSVYSNYHRFANALLQRGGTTCLAEYIQGASASFDTQLASARLQLDAATIADILAWLHAALAAAPPPDQERIFRFMVRRFESLAAR